MIKNKSELLSHGFVKGREIALDIVEHALQEVNPYTAVKETLELHGNQLQVGEEQFDLSATKNIYAIGAGKATYPLAVALEEILGDRITDGFIAVKEGQTEPFSRMWGHLSSIRFSETAHPIPDKRSLDAGKEIYQIAQQAEKGDMVFCLMSGGVSAQSVYPVAGISLQDKMIVNRLLVHSGADITEVMTVRRHLSRIKGGRLANVMLPATVISLTVSDEKTDTMEWNTDWTSPDSTTLSDAMRVLEKYGLFEKVSMSVQRYLSTPTPEKETPKTFTGAPLHNFMVVRTRDLADAAVVRAKEIGLTPVLLTTLLNGESREVGRTITSIAKEIHLSGHPFKAPCALIATGETAVRIEGTSHGLGGANQELAAGGCLDLQQTDPIVICALDTDGTDGPTELSGALTDGSTVRRAAQKGYDFYRKLMAHDVAGVLKAVDDAIITGPTGTNVNDLIVGIIL